MSKQPSINWIKESEAMELLGLAKKTLRIYTRDETRKRLPIRSSKITGRTILYSKTDIDTLINSNAI